jgi:hypothetical protein
MNKYYLFGSITVVGILATTLGAWAKITHQAWAQMVISLGLLFQGIGLAALVWFLFMWLKRKK